MDIGASPTPRIERRDRSNRRAPINPLSRRLLVCRQYSAILCALVAVVVVGAAAATTDDISMIGPSDWPPAPASVSASSIKRPLGSLRRTCAREPRDRGCDKIFRPGLKLRPETREFRRRRAARVGAPDKSQLINQQPLCSARVSSICATHSRPRSIRHRRRPRRPVEPCASQAELLIGSFPFGSSRGAT